MAACRHCGKRPKVSSKTLRRMKVKKRELRHGFCAHCLAVYRRTTSLSPWKALKKLKRRRDKDGLYFRRAYRGRMKKSGNLGVSPWDAYVELHEIQKYFRIPTYSATDSALRNGAIPLRVLRRRLPDFEGRKVLHRVVSKRKWEALKRQLEAGDIPWRMRRGALIFRVPQLRAVLAQQATEQAERKRRRRSIVVSGAR